jgi:hypothetical protein
MKERDITGKTFSQLTGIKKVGHHVSTGGISSIKWLFMCDCGNERIARSNDVMMKKVKACKVCTKIKRAESSRTNGEFGGKSREFGFENAAFRARASHFKAGAKYRGHEWALTPEETCEIMKRDCHYCGHPPAMDYDYIKGRSAKHKKKLLEKNVPFMIIKFNGLDRVNSDLGYTKENSVPCCADCNFAKNDKTVEEFMEWLNRISNFQAKKLK